MDQYNAGDSDTQTEFTLLYLDEDGYRHEIGTRSYGSSSATDLRWINAFAVQFSSLDPPIATTDKGSKSLYLQVRTTSSSRANGFHMWAGPPHGLHPDVSARNAVLESDPEEGDTEGVAIYGQGKLPVNVAPARTPITMTLAYVPPAAAGHALRVFNFDMDNQDASPSGQVTFYLEGAPDFSPQAGQLSQDGGSGTWAATALQLPSANQFFGAYLKVAYTDNTPYSANASTWRLEYDDLVTQLASVRLIQ
jgi:hypothetical protein